MTLLLSRSIESGPSDGTTNASTSCVIVPRMSENTTNPKTFNDEPFAARKGNGGRWNRLDSNRTQGWVRRQPCVRNYGHISSSINSDCGHWIVFYKARNLHSARRKKQRKRMGFACQPRAVPRGCLFIIIWANANTTHDTQVCAAWQTVLPESDSYRSPRRTAFGMTFDS